MKQYDSSIGRTILAPILVAVIIVAGFAAAMIWFPGGTGPTTTTTTTTSPLEDYILSFAIQKFRTQR
ncbi:MAG: hypothetical protein ACFFER_07615, partial [Candidatus Thorarchaeota archaeon]